MPIQEMRLMGLLAFRVVDPIKHTAQEITAQVVSYSDDRGSTRNGPNLTADVGTFTLTLLDDSEDLWEDKFDLQPNQIMIPLQRYSMAGTELGTFIIQDLVDGVEYDDEGNLTKTLEVTGVDYVQKYSNSSVKEVLTGARKMIAVQSLADDAVQGNITENDYHTMTLYTVEEFRERTDADVIEPPTGYWSNEPNENPDYEGDQFWHVDPYDARPWWVEENPGAVRALPVFSTVDAIEPSWESVNSRIARLIDLITDPSAKERNDTTNPETVRTGRIIYSL